MTGVTSRRVDTAALTEIRAREPERIARLWDERTLRPLLPADGRLLLVAADHPARAALGVRGDGMAMASRSDLLARLVTALERPGVDGVLGTPDVLDDLLLLGALEGKVVIGSMNRGGLQGSVWELDDRFTGYTARRGRRSAASTAARCSPASRSATPAPSRTLEACARAVTELAALGRMAMVEPFWSVVEQGRVVNLLDPDSMIRVDPRRVGPRGVERPHLAQAARGRRPRAGHGRHDAADPAARRRPPGRPAARRTPRGAARSSCPAVRGLVVGRALLYPPDADVAAAVDIAADLVHGGVA